MNSDERAAVILIRARQLFRRERSSSNWSSPSDIAHDHSLARIQAQYLQRAEDELLREGAIQSVDQT